MKLETYKRQWVSEKEEIRNYIFATDTRTTTNRSLPWKNSTHIPKLCQIRDNLTANYMSTLFPNDRSIKWEGDDESSESKSKRKVIEGYIINKLRTSGFRTEIEKSILDWIDYGNAFGAVEYVNDTYTDELGEVITRYKGPRFTRISPLDIVFDPTASTFEAAPKVVRSIETLASLAVAAENSEEGSVIYQAVSKSLKNRAAVAATSPTDAVKNGGYIMDGFGSWLDYFKTDRVELLTFFGDVIGENGKVLKNRRITVLDRCYVIVNEQQSSWLGFPPIFHVGWRLRPDNLYAMGPLDNLVGMQYRIDHLENAKADAYDLIVSPVQKITGYVEDYSYGPGERIYVGDDGNVEFMRPDTTMLSADTQIAMYEAKMEEMAGAPRQAMGLRTPGEKTAFEVQILENGANKIFIKKTGYFEEMFLEPILNAMLEVSRRTMDTKDVAKVTDDQFGVVDFLSITREDIKASGKLRPIGARHFARNANILQNLVQFASTPLGQDAAVAAHISGKGVALLIEELLGLERFQLVQDNVRISEALETQRVSQSANQIASEEAMVAQEVPV